MKDLRNLKNFDDTRCYTYKRQTNPEGAGSDLDSVLRVRE